MPIPADALLPTQSTLETASRNLRYIVSLVLVVLLGGILEGIFSTNVVGGADTTDSDAKTNCANCGARIHEDASACEHCGKPH